MTKETFTFFWHGPLSQWYISPFKDSEGIIYNCAEQYMMAHKAKLFKDEKSYQKIMKSKDPKEQKKLGRAVRNFNEAIWGRECKKIVYKGNYFKFIQNVDLLRKLLETEGTTLVEASPYDKIWGIGLSADDPKAKRRDKWQGKNWLGEILTKLRDDFIEGVM